MQDIIQKIFDNNINIYAIADKYYNTRTPFTGLFSPDITNKSWQYSVNHLPVSIFLTNKKRINYVLHLPGDHYYVPTSMNQNVTFSGWHVYSGETHRCTCIIDDSGDSDECCIIHINLRDLYTDSLEFISNLMLHIKYMQLHDTDSVIICKNNANLKSIADTCNNDTIMKTMDLSQPPKYSVKFNATDRERAKIFMAIKFDAIFAEMFANIMALCDNHDNIKIHVIQGACTQFTLMTSLHPENMDLRNVQLSNHYGGAYKEYDEYIGRLLKGYGGSLWNEINMLNAEWYKYIIHTHGLTCGIINLNKVKASHSMDPIFRELMESIPPDENHVLLNINYSFGSEGQFIAEAMQKCFGDRLSSFQLIGKAGGIGPDVKLNDYVICNSLSIAYPTTFNIPANRRTIKIPHAKKIDKTLYSGGEIKVHDGGVKIMPCVLFESKEYLESIHEKYFAVEMEGFWFQQAFNPALPTVYLYYISDLPLENSLAHEDYPKNEGQTLFNGLLRMGFKWIKNIIQNKSISISRRSQTTLPTLRTPSPKTSSSSGRKR
jgi:hypothetical protein